MTGPNTKRVMCLSWVPSLAETRGMLLRAEGYDVVSLLGADDIARCAADADLLVLAHSVPLEFKRQAIQLFRCASKNPVLSLLSPHQTKLAEADYGVEALSPIEFIETVTRILA